MSVLKIKYRAAAEPNKLKLYDSDMSYVNSPFLHRHRGLSAEEWGAEELEKFKRDKAAGRILEFEVIDDVEAEKMQYQQNFEFYKKRLVKGCGEHGRFRFNVIEYLCGFPGIDPVEMAVALKKDGFEIVFDDSSIPHKENVKKHYAVERRFAEETKSETVDGLIADASERSVPVDSKGGKDVEFGK